MDNGRLGEGEWLVRDGAAKVMFFALAWTVAQWSGSSRIKARASIKSKGSAGDRPFNDTEDGALSQTFEAMEKLLRDTVAPTSKGFVDRSIAKDRDDAGIRALIKQEQLEGICFPDSGLLLWPATQWLVKGLAMPPVSDPGARLKMLLGSVLVCGRFSTVSGIPLNQLKLAKWHAGEPEKCDTAKEKGLTNAFQKTAAPVVRMLAGSENSIERTTLALYDQKNSLDRFQQFPADAEKQASPLPLPVIIRFARLFGFSPVDDEQADPHTLAQRLAAMPPKRQAIWNAFCGQNDDADLLRGATVQAFGATFEEALAANRLGRAGQAWVELAPESGSKAKGRTPSAEESGASPGTDAAHTAPPHRDDDIIVNAKSSDDENIGMTIAPRLDQGRIVLGSIRYRLDQHADAKTVDWRACLVGLVVRWVWQQGIQAELLNPGPAANETAIRAANPQHGVKWVRLDTARLDVEIFPAKPGTALMPDPACAVERLVLPPARLRPSIDVMHSFELHASWQHVGFLEHDANGQEVLHDRSAVARLIEERVSASLLLRDYALQLRAGFPDDGRLRQLGVRQATVESIEAVDAIGDRR
jgi:hypothetical protein